MITQAQLDPSVRPGERPYHVGAFGQQLSQQVAHPRIAWRFGRQPGEQRFGLSRLAHHEQRPRQLHPRIDGGGAAVLDRAHETIGCGGRLIGEQPLFACPHVCLGTRHRGGLGAGVSQLCHFLRRCPVIARGCGVEFDCVKSLTA